MAARSKGNYAKHRCDPLAEYRPFFVVLDENYRTVLTARSSLSQGDVREIRVLIKDYLDLVNSAEHFELAESLKLHALAVHVVEFSEKYPTTSSCYGQQAVSQCLFLQRIDTFKTVQESVGYWRTVIEYSPPETSEIGKVLFCQCNMKFLIDCSQFMRLHTTVATNLTCK